MPISQDEEAGRAAPYLVVSALSAGYGREPVVSDISVSVTLGEVVSVIGPNGAGKSTVLKAMAGMIPVMAGTVTLDGEDVTNLRSNRLARRGLGYVPQTGGVFEGVSVLENLEMGGCLFPPKGLQGPVDHAPV